MTLVDEVLTHMRENMESTVREAWRMLGTMPPTMVTMWHPERVFVVPILDTGFPEDAVQKAVAETGAQAYLLVFTKAVKMPTGAHEWCMFLLWGAGEGQCGGTLFPLQQTPLEGRTVGAGRECAPLAQELWRVVYGTPPLAPTVN